MIKNHRKGVIMVNTEKLNAFIKDSGLKRETIAKRLGISMTTLKAKVDGKIDFKSEEILILKEILNLSLSDIGDLFFNLGGDLESHKSEQGNG